MTYEIKNLVWDNQINQSIYPMFLDYLAVIESRKEELYKNYTIPTLDLENHLTFDIVFRENKIVGFSGIYNGGRYPEGVYRVLNRTYFDPSVRNHSLAMREFEFSLSKKVLPYQIEKCWGRLKFIFVSVQNIKGKPYLQKWVKHLAPKLETPWEVSDKLVKVTVGDATRGCFQYIAYNKIDNKINWPDITIDKEQWLALPYE